MKRTYLDISMNTELENNIFVNVWVETSSHLKIVVLTKKYPISSLNTAAHRCFCKQYSVWVLAILTDLRIFIDYILRFIFLAKKILSLAPNPKEKPKGYNHEHDIQQTTTSFLQTHTY